MENKIDFNKLELNPSGNIVKKKHTIKHSKENALERHEQEELIQAVKKSKFKTETQEKYLVLVHLLMNSGLRVSEAIQTRLSWFNETEDGITLNVPKKDRDLRNMKRDWKPKTESGAREVIFLDKGIGQQLKSFFTYNKSLGFSRQRAGQIIKTLGKSINKPDLHPHALRSTYANNLVYAGVNVSTLQYYMGWANINTALNYVRSSKIAARKDLIEKFNEQK